MDQRLKYALLFLFGFVLYGNTLPNGYSVDDYLVAEGNETVQKGVKGIPEILTTNFLRTERYQASYRPMARITFAIEHSLFGVEPQISHLINLLLYVTTACLLLLLLQSLFPRSDRMVFLAVLLFMAHPVHTEVVAGLKSRDELLSFLFGISSVLTALSWYSKGKPVWLAGSALLFLFALMSKESGQVFLALIPLALYFSGDLRKGRMFTAVIAGILPSLVFWGFVFGYLPSYSREAFTFLENPLMEVGDFNLRYGTAFYSLGYSLRLLVFPHPLGFFYGYSQIPLVGFQHPGVLASVLGYAMLTLIAFWKLGSKHVLSFSALWYLLSIFMFSNLLFPVAGVVAERFVYAGSLGFCLAAAYGLSWLIGQAGASTVGKWIGVGITVLLLGLYTAKTIDRNFDWKDHLTLATHDARVFQNSGIIHIYCDQQLELEQKKVKKGPDQEKLIRQRIWHNRQLVRIHPPLTDRYKQLGLLYARDLGRPDSALTWFQEYVFRKPDARDGQYNLARCYFLNGEYDAAEAGFLRALVIDPSHELSKLHMEEIRSARENVTP